ncbi:hypothetical protein BE20_11335 [Sorangium cellulosum]|uniref:Uncharacterized protein n=1 Tax=Sorangium cellulosum TaxID=56 RepID=A0A150SJF0_SORCE|nr:hypothetical protein BE20_11335 [Sorangium cellulosum]KYG02904.1 hypothetical protein BE18_30805 [Sorangium cellulosum]
MGVGFPSGHCTGACNTDSDCAGGGVCIALTTFNMCVAPCETADDCRDGYMCDTDDTCWPGCTSDAQCPEAGTCADDGFCGAPASPDGSACADDGDCTGEWCISQADYGFPGGYCSGFCGLDTECTGGGTCYMEPGDTTGICLTACTTDSDCRGGYICDADNTCYPACTSDAQCSDGYVCNALGYCDPPAGDGADGDACTADADCAGGFCFSDADGWPGGYCTGPCTPGADDCAGGGYCDSDSEGNSACIAECGTTDDCRDGYVCSSGLCL